MEGKARISSWDRIPRVAVVGGGPTGALSSLVFQKHGFQVELLESETDPRQESFSKEEEMPMLLGERGMAALERIGGREAAKRFAIEITGRTIHTSSLEIKREPFGDPREKLYCMSRKDLRKFLLDSAESNGVRLNFESSVTNVDIHQGLLHVEHGATQRQMRIIGGREPQMQVEVVVGSDGHDSIVAEEMKRSDRLDYSRSFNGHGYMHITIPSHNGMFPFDPTSFHIWPRRNFGMLALPNMDQTFTCILCMPFHGKNSFERLRTEGEALDFLGKEFPDVTVCFDSKQLKLLQKTVHPMSFSEMHPAHIDRRALVLGEAALQLLPVGEFHDSIGLEDCLLLDQLLGKHGMDKESLTKVFRRYSEERADRSELLQFLSRITFDSVVGRSPGPYLRAKQILQDVFQRYLPRVFGYFTLREAVSFSTSPYPNVRAMSRSQDVGLGIFGVFVLAGMTAGTSYVYQRRWKMHEEKNLFT